MIAFVSTTPTLPQPWYKQFWPWFLIVLPSVAVIASFITLGIAIKHADTPVQGDYEKHGLTVLHKTAVPLETTVVQKTTVPNNTTALQKNIVQKDADDRAKR